MGMRRPEADKLQGTPRGWLRLAQRGKESWVRDPSTVEKRRRPAGKPEMNLGYLFIMGLVHESDLDVTDYDEEDSDGFKYTRTRAKKAKAEPAPHIPPIEEDQHEHSPEAAPVKKTRKRTSGSPNAIAAEKGDEPQRRRRSPRHSGDKDLGADGEPPVPPLEVKKKRRPKDDGSQEARKGSKKHEQAISAQSKDSTAAEPPRTQPVDKPLDPIKVSLPFADTPIIRRNKEMRKGVENGSRRSSLGQRGRRASSLIDSGKSDGKDITCSCSNSC